MILKGKYMKVTRLFLGLCILSSLTVLGCGDTSENVQQQVSFNTLQKGTVSPHALDSQFQINVFRNEVGWANFWNLLYTNYSSKPALPSVNFSDNVILSVIDSSRSSGGYSITITQIQASTSGVTVYALQESPGQGCGSTTAFDQPFHIVTTPIFSGVAALNLSQSVRNCSP